MYIEEIISYILHASEVCFFFQKQTSLYNLAFEVDRASLPVVAGNEQLYTKSPFSLDFGDD